jgi:hypothetical protein
MADIDVKHKSERGPGEYTMGDLVFWILGILAVPLIPILMMIFLTPHSGM